MALPRRISEPCESCGGHDDHLWCLPGGWLCDGCYGEIARQERESRARERLAARARRRWKIAGAVAGLITGVIVGCVVIAWTRLK